MIFFVRGMNAIDTFWMSCFLERKLMLIMKFYVKMLALSLQKFKNDHQHNLKIISISTFSSTSTNRQHKKYKNNSVMSLTLSSCNNCCIRTFFFCLHPQQHQQQQKNYSITITATKSINSAHMNMNTKKRPNMLIRMDPFF